MLDEDEWIQIWTKETSWRAFNYTRFGLFLGKLGNEAHFYVLQIAHHGRGIKRGHFHNEKKVTTIN